MSVGELLVDFASQLNATDLGEHFPEDDIFKFWAQSAYSCVSDQPAEVAIRIVEAQQMRELNSTYRGKDKPTNVLSFPCELPEEIQDELSHQPLGDILICHAVVSQEALEQGKCLRSHYAHLTVHGILHLCGYDHEIEADATQMESLEITILHRLGIPNPYTTNPAPQP